MFILISFLISTIFVIGLTIYLTKSEDTSSSTGYFLAGRTLTALPIAMSLVMTNLSATQIVGLPGQVYGPANMQPIGWEIGLVPVFIFICLYLLPRYLKQGVYTTLDFFALRYDKQMMLMGSWLYFFYGLLHTATALFAGSIAMVSIFQLGNLFPGIELNTLIILIAFILTIISAFFAISGGLRTVVVSDTIYGTMLILIGIFVPILALIYLGEGNMVKGFENILITNPEKFNAIGGAEETWPFPTVFTGMIIVHTFFWGFNQTVVQRVLGTKNLAEGQKAYMIAGFLKLTIPPIMILLPGIIAYTIFQGKEFTNNDFVYGELVNLVLPTPIIGIFAATLFGAIISTVNSGLNSVSSNLVMNIFRKPSYSDKYLASMGRRVTFLVAIIACLSVYFLLNFEGGVFLLIQKISGYFLPPLFFTILLGYLSSRAPAIAAKIGFFFYLIMYILLVDVFRINVHYLYIMTGLSIAMFALMLIIRYIKPRSEKFVLVDKHVIDTQENWKGLKWSSIGLMTLMILYYIILSPIGIAK
ncbi:MAG: solute:sodium symporter family transporter [Brevinema sp.]